MPSADIIKELQELYLADDIEVPGDAVGWSREEAEAFFESGGQVRPPAPTSTGNAITNSLVAAPSTATVVPSPPPPPPPPISAGVYRWIVDISTWEPGDAEWQLLLGA